MEQEETYVGIDVAKAQVDVAIRPADDRWRVSHDEAGIRQRVSRLKTLEPVMVLLEASGGLELPLVAALAAEAVPVVVVNPRQVRDFAKATGKLAKTDSLDAGSGESEIRRYIFENDLLEALIALPEQLFYNTGIATYVWLLTNRKAPERQGKVQFIDASSFWAPMRQSLGDKRRQITPERAEDILKLLVDYRDGKTCVVIRDGSQGEAVVSRVFPTSHFGFRKITVERPLRLSFLANPERIARLEEERGFQSLAKSKKRGYAASQEEAQGLRLQRSLRDLLNELPETTLPDRKAFETMLDEALKEAELKLPAPAKRAVLSALSERDETAAVCRGRNGEPEPDPELRDTERVPLTETVEDFFEREVLPHVPDAWIDESKRDPKDGQVGVVGYEINFNRHFYRYTPPRPLEDIERDIQAIEADIMRMLSEVTGAAS